VSAFLGSIFNRGLNFSPLHDIQTGFGDHSQSLIQWVSGGISPGQSGRSLPLNAEV
jgi:hypothetical protein